MLSTHGLIGLFLGYLSVILSTLSPEYALITGFLGGIFPDIDLVKNHRKTLHFPIYYPLGLLTASFAYLLYTETALLYIALFLSSATFHTLIDVFSGGLAPVKFKKPKKFPIYNHYQDKWIELKPLTYDGSPTDFLVSLTIGSILVYTMNSLFVYLAAILLIISTVYFTFRMRIHRLSLKLLDLN